MTTTYITRGAKYHADANCPLMNSGEDLWDCEGDDYGGWHNSGSYRRTSTVQDATMRGKLPCLHCVPAEARAFPPLYGQTFGHVPFVYDGAPICKRCFLQRRSYREAVAWPCTSALILGLVPREAS